MSPEIDISMDLHLAQVALKSGLHVSQTSAEAERYPSKEELNRYKLENVHLKKSVLEKDSAMKVMSTGLVDIE